MEIRKQKLGEEMCELSVRFQTRLMINKQHLVGGGGSINLSTQEEAGGPLPSNFKAPWSAE